MRELPALERLQELFHYDPETGHLTRLKAVRGMGAVDAVVGTPNSDGHLTVRVDFRICYIHRIAWKMFYSEEPPPILDHINKLCTDNRITNLRGATCSQNSQNRRLGKNNKTGVSGVYYRQHLPRPWKADIKANGKVIHLGHFATREAAVAARREAEVKYHKEFAGTFRA